MLLNRLTSCLMGLMVLFMLVFPTTAVIAAPGGPTVTITEYTGNENVANNTGAAHVQERSDFRVKLTFSHRVTAPIASNVSIQLGNSTGLVGPSTNPTDDPTAVTASNGKEYVAVFDVFAITDSNEATEAAVTIPANAVTGNTVNNIWGNQPGSGSFTLPPILGPLKVKVTNPTAVSGKPGAYTVTFTFGDGTNAPDPAFTKDYIAITPKGDAIAADTEVPDSINKLGVYTSEIQLVFGVTSVTVGVAPGYATMDGSAVILPPPPPVTQAPPSVSMQVASHDPTLREFRLEVTFTPGLKSNGEPGDPVTVGKWTETEGKDFLPSSHLKFTDATNIEVPLTSAVDRASDNNYVSIFTYSLLDTLPLTITTVDDFKTSDDPRTSVMVGGPVTPADITFTPNQIPNQTFVVNMPITPFYLPIATGGTAPYTYTLAPLPTGLAFNATTQELSGTPTVLGKTTSTYTATDAANRAGTLTFTIEVLAGNTPSVIPDAKLAAAVWRSLSLAANTPLTVAVMAQLKNLDAYGAGVVQLDGLEHATNLTTLDLGMNQITNISTLASLTKLTHLYLDDNQITDVTALSGLTNLRLLRLAGNTIQNTTPLATLLQQNPGLDLDIPVTPPQVDSVTFTDGKLETAVRIALRMTASETITKETMLRLFFLEAYDRRIASIQGLEHATNLIALDLGKNAIVDISPLSGLTQLQILFLDNNQIVDVSPLKDLAQLDLLFLTGNPISSLAPISHLIDDIQIFRSKAEQ